MTIDPANPNVRRAWLADLRLRGDRADAIHATADRLFLYTENNHVLALSRAGGTIDWGAQIGDPFSAILPPLEVGDRFVFPVNTRLFIYDRYGVMERAQDVGFAMPAPGVSDGKNMVYIPAAHRESQRVAAIDVNRQVGPVVWEFMTRGPVSAAPAIHGGIIYVGSEDNRVYAVSQNRRPVWPLEGFAFETAGRVVADVRADETGVYVASTDTKLYCLERAGGRIKWTWYGQAPLTTPPMVTADAVYQYSPAMGLVALEKAGIGNRTARWNQSEALQVLSAGAKAVYVRFRDNTIGALDKGTGEVLWRGSTKYSKFVTNARDAMIFVATDAGAVYAYLPVGEAAAKRVAPPAAIGTATPARNGAATPAAAPVAP
jgi:outer membrane protein assembly factor BamB